MSIITWRDGVMSGDGLITVNDIRIGEYVKVRSYPQAIVGAVGNLNLCDQFFDKFDSSKAEMWPKHSPYTEDADFEALVYDRETGILNHVFYSIIGIEIGHPFTAIGIGAPLALAAMHAGASAEEAVRATIATHVHCGGQITTIKI